LVPSQKLESFGYAALEAMVLKKPVISTNCGGLPEVVKNNFNGFIVNKKNYKEFAKKIYLLANNHKLRIKMGQNGHKRYLKFFQAKDMSKKYSDLIKND
jgi:glycosyltransferase involved in cell wall biosynthesis